MSDENEIKSYPGRGFELPPSKRGWLPLDVPTDLNLNTVKLVKSFAEALMLKLLAAQEKYGYTDQWMNPCIIPDLQQDLVEHMQKGDPRDVAAYCAFLWHHNEPTMKEDDV
jgi:hypothetical protein